MNIIDKAMRAADDHDLQTLDDIWTDMALDENLPLSVFFDIADRLKQQHPDHALLLLEMLAAHYESQNRYRQTIEVLRKTVYFRTRTDDIRNKLAELYREHYKDSTRVDDYIRAAGLLTADSLFKALDKLDEYLIYDIGSYFYFERYGLGQVVETDPEKQEIVVDFEKKKHHFLTLDLARGLLMPVTQEHFLYRKAIDPDELKQLAAHDQEELVLLLLRSMKDPMSPAQIKRHLSGIIDEKNVAGFWERVRKMLEKNSRVRVITKPQKMYSLVESGADRTDLAKTAFTDASPREQYRLAEEYARTMPDVFSSLVPLLVRLGNNMVKKDPPLALDILLLCTRTAPDISFDYSLETILNDADAVIVTHVHAHEHQKIVLEHLMQHHPEEWPRMFRQILFSGTDHKLFEEVSRFLTNASDIMKDTYRTIFSFPRKYPHQYRWMLKKIQAGDLPEYIQPGFLPRMIDSLEYIKGIKGTVHKILTLERFDSIIQGVHKDEAQRILTAVKGSTSLEEYLKQDLQHIITHHHPALIKKERIDIYTTEAALLSKQQELEHLLTVEIPANRKEISRAREFGDLSENFEYKAAKEKQGQLLEKVRVLESDLQQALLIRHDDIDTSRVSIGTRVTLTTVNDRTDVQYDILGRWDTDLEKNIISNEAPIAQTLLDKVCGDVVTVSGQEYEITRIERAL